MTEMISTDIFIFHHISLATVGSSAPLPIAPRRGTEKRKWRVLYIRLKWDFSSLNVRCEFSGRGIKNFYLVQNVFLKIFRCC